MAIDDRPRTALTWPWVAAALLSLLVGRAQGGDLFDIPATPPARIVGSAYFGTHFHRLDHAEGDRPATAWPRGQVGALRLWDASVRWADLEQAPGRVDFSRLDDAVDRARTNGASLLLVLGSPPGWASARPQEPCPYGLGCSAEPRDLADWDRYVGTVVRRYKGRIAQYELWNEPYFSDLLADRDQPGAFFSGSVATMVELARRARAVIDAVDPRAQLIGPGFVGSPDRLAMFLRAGGGRYVDAIAYHFYVDDDAQFVQLNARVRDVMARAELARLPLVNTESGYAVQPAMDRHAAAAVLARAMVLGAYLGLDRFYQYAWDDGRMGMLLPDGRTPTDSARAFAAVRRWLVGTTLKGCHSLAGGGVACEAARGDARLTIGWQAAGWSGAPRGEHAPDALTLPNGQRVTSIENATGGEVPPPAPALENLATRRRVELPADGMPVAVWSRFMPVSRHTGVASER